MNNIAKVIEAIKQAEAILIGASNGLSITEGLHLFAENEAFVQLFGDIQKENNIRCILQGMCTNWKTEEEKWGFWSRLIHHYCGSYTPTPTMKRLRELVGEKDYFVVTSNGECHFEMCGFEEEKVFEIEGNWLTMQCENGCHNTLYKTLELAEEMAKVEKEGKVPTELIPYCNKCGAPMKIHMIGENFIYETKKQEALQQFLNTYHNKKMLVLELGIGFRNQLIKAPFMNLVEKEPNAIYVTINLGEVYIKDSIKNKSIGIDGGLEQVIKEIYQGYFL